MTENLKLLVTHFPDWHTYIYVGSDVPKSYVDEYASFSNVKCIFTNETGGRLMAYRFFPIDDPDVDIMLVRDADSRIGERDQWCIREFLASDKKAHIIRDHYHHRMRIMGGMWGVKKGVLPPLRSLYTEWIASRADRDNYNTDQLFLQECIYPLIKECTLIHSWIIGFKGETVSPIDFPNTGTNFVGNVYEYNASTGEFYPSFNNKHFPVAEQRQFLQRENQLSVLRH
jgi:hypothetical protein